MGMTLVNLTPVVKLLAVVIVLVFSIAVSRPIDKFKSGIRTLEKEAPKIGQFSTIFYYLTAID
jgi:hypothetical protein